MGAAPLFFLSIGVDFGLVVSKKTKKNKNESKQNKNRNRKRVEEKVKGGLVNLCG